MRDEKWVNVIIDNDGTEVAYFYSEEGRAMESARLRMAQSNVSRVMVAKTVKVFERKTVERDVT